MFGKLSTSWQNSQSIPRPSIDSDGKRRVFGEAIFAGKHGDMLRRWGSTGGRTDWSVLLRRPYSSKLLWLRFPPTMSAIFSSMGFLTGLYCVRADDPPTIKEADAKCPR